MNFVKTENMPDLICIKCRKVLSQFPIYCHSDGPTCGRCPYPQNGIRNEAYETIAQNLKFPCSYNGNGCLENLYPKNVATHEKFCSFRKHICPISSTPNCKWKGVTSDLLEHVEKKHPTFLLDEKSFELDFVNSHNENYLIPYGESLYIVNRRAESKTHTFYCTVSYIGNDASADNNLYKIILESGNKTYKHEKSNRINATTEILRDELTSVLNDPTLIVARIEIYQEEEMLNDDSNDEPVINKSLNYELLKDLECPYCMEYMIPPIYQCITGHSICQGCKAKYEECPTCNQEFKDTQNYALAQILNHIDYPCKFSKCKFSSKARNIRQHEATCAFAPYPCPLKDYIPCTKEFQVEQLYDHIVNSHYENLLELETVSLPFNVDIDEEIEDCFIIKYKTKLFKLHFYYQTLEFDFAAQLIGPPEQLSQYRLEIDILDATGKNNRTYCKKPCGRLTDKHDAFTADESITFPMEQIKHLISDQLCFRARITIT